MQESQGFFVILARLSCYPDAEFGIRIAAERRAAKIFECLAAPVELLNRVCAAKIGLAAAVEMVLVLDFIQDKF
jgi:hypothetical protein